jgi:magnesium-transporting ATPase (P-type)
MLCWAATIYLICSIFGTSDTAYVESLTIYTGLLLICLISGLCDWWKERQFLQLRKEINSQKAQVYRGAYGTVTEIPITDLVVGDVVDLQQGDRVPADCILLEEMNITVDQQYYFPIKENETEYVEKEQSTGTEKGQPDNHKKNPDPFMLTDSKIMTGQGKAIICAVGENTLLARIRGKEDLDIQET